MVKEKRYSIDPANFFLIASLVLGVLYAVFVPYGAGFDEERHLARIYYMSLGEYMPGFPKSTIQQEVFELSYQRRYVQSPAFDMYTKEGLSRKFSRLEEDLLYGYRTQSIYSPAIFLPQALIGRIMWWKFNFPILPTIILQRIAGLLIYILGTYAAIRILPFGKWVFTALALAPAALYQSSTLNADGFTAAASFLFIAQIVAMYKNESEGIKPRSVVVLFFIMLWLGLAKPGAIILFPLLLILVKHPFSSKKWLALLFGGILIAIALNIGWWSVASGGSAFAGEGAQSVSREISVFGSTPFEFLKLVFESLVSTFSAQIQGWIAAYGFWAGKVPPLVYFLWFVFLLLAFGLEKEKVILPFWVRTFLIGLFFFSSLAIYTVVFIPSHVYGGLTALAKHGRYYIPFGPLLFLGLSGLFVFRYGWRTVATKFAIFFFLLAHIFYSVGIYTTYYTYCGYDAYLGDKCVLPIYKNLEKEDAPFIILKDGLEISQTFTKFCGDLEQVDIFVKNLPDTDDGLLNFSLLDTDQKTLFSTSIPTQDIRQNLYLNIPISVQPNEQNDEYELRFSTSNMPKEGIELALSSTDFYPGKLFINGEVRQQDLLLHYACTAP